MKEPRLKDNEDFNLGERPTFSRPLFGDGILSLEGKEWKASRDLVRPQFMHTRSDNFPIMQEVVEQLLETLRANAEDTTVDLQSLFFQMTIRTTLRIFVGSAYQRSEADYDIPSFSKAFSEAQVILTTMTFPYQYKLLPFNRRFRRVRNETRSFVNKIADAALAQRPSPTIKDSEKDHYLYLNALIGVTRDRRVLGDNILQALLAGRDSTTALLSWAL